VKSYLSHTLIRHLVMQKSRGGGKSDGDTGVHVRSQKSDHVITSALDDPRIW